MRRGAWLAAVVALTACARPATGPAGPGPAEEGQRELPGPPVGLEVVEDLRFPPLRFAPPEPESFELSNGVTVFFLKDDALPLIDLFIDLKGGYSYFDREAFGAASALPSMMRNGGTRELPPDSVDALIDFNALGMSTSADGSRIVIGVSALRRQLDLALDLWSGILLRPRFDPEAIERWRLRELESVRRLGDFPGSLAVLEFNRLMYGDHPTGWRMRERDLAPDQVTRERLLSIHAQTVCPERAVIGAAGDLEVDELRARLEAALGGWRRCGNTLEPPALPELAREPTIYVIPKTLPQSTIVVGQPGGVRIEESRDYFASRVANWLIGGSGFTSRLMSRLRTEEGLAYSAASIWGASRDHERIFGAITHTKSESTLITTRVLIELLEDVVEEPPRARDVALAREALVNGFVFGFSTPVQVVARQVSYLADGFPADWLDRYIRGIRDVDSASVARVLRRHVRPDRFTIVIVGDTTQFDVGALGAVQILPAR